METRELDSISTDRDAIRVGRGGVVRGKDDQEKEVGWMDKGDKTVE